MLEKKAKNRFADILLVFLLSLLTNKLIKVTILDKTSVYAHGIHQQNHMSTPPLYTIIKPKVVHGRYKRSLEHTLDEDGLHASHLTLSYQVDKKNVIIDLFKNEELIPNGHFVSYQSNGDKKIIKYSKTDIDLCHYHGTIRGNLNSQVAVSTCKGVKGIVNDGTETFYIETGANETLNADHYLYKHSELSLNGTCGYEGGLDKNHDPELFKESEISKLGRFKRSIDTETTIRGPYNAKKHSSYVELVIVIDHKLYQNMNEDIKSIHLYCKNIANIINALYVPLNVFISLVGVVIWSENNEVELSSDGDKTLKNFLHYRRKTLVKEHPNDNAQLLTKEHFDGGVVGKALKGPICTFEFSGGVSMDHSPIIGVVATTVAHEMGHNFGMEHDSTDCKCQDDRCIMSASSSSIAPRYWSSCSIDQINLAFHHGMNYCLKNKPTKIFDSPVCGNNFVEPGEQCDCGLQEYCTDNSCCNAATCMLHANASCATGDCCDLKTCKPKNAGIMCRDADSSCDLPEYCTGESEFCPSDVFKRDTETCDDGKAFCYRGVCRSQSDQCKLLWGPTGKSSSDACYDKNTDGSRHGNCGYDRLKQEYLRCNKGDKFCGMLHCRHLNERLEFGMESVAVLSHSFINSKGSIIPCRTAIVDLGLQSTDPGLTPDGAKCGENKMCINQKCLSVMDLRTGGKATGCLNDCNGNGICNNIGMCHCNKGFAPPSCIEPGVGGSLVSGPASDPNEGSSFSRILYVFFLGVCPACGLFAIFIYYYKQNQFNWIMTRKSVPKMPPTKQLSMKTSSSGLSGGPSSPSSPDDMNSLIQQPERSTASATTEMENENNNMFGRFKGFTLKPLPDPARGNSVTANNIAYVHPVNRQESSSGVTRAAPLPPKMDNRNLKQVQPVQPIVHKSTTKSEEMVTNLEKVEFSNVGPALPPPNPKPVHSKSHPRLIISNPILENSTCTAKELQSPLKNTNNHIRTLPPVRPAPAPPQYQNENLFASCEILINPVSADKVPTNKNGTLKRLASLLKKDGSDLPSNPASQVKSTKTIDREKLKNIQISSPIPIVDGDDIEDEATKILRSQSMRDPQPVIKRQPNFKSFGSMRRPPSIVDRPTVPPPRPPAPMPLTATVAKESQNSSFAKQSVNSCNEYDDCEAIEGNLAHISEESSPSSPTDNIYSVIDEPSQQQTAAQNPNKDGINSSSDSNLGSLLGEIVSEFENRKLDSIYIINKQDKKNVKANSSGDDDDSSTTSSGYLRPTALRPAPNKTPEGYSIPVPQAPKAVSLSSFKTETKPPPNVNKVAASKSAGSAKKQINVAKFPQTPLSRTVTPPSLNNTKAATKIETTKVEKPKPLAKPSVTRKPDMVKKGSTTNKVIARPNHNRDQKLRNFNDKTVETHNELDSITRSVTSKTSVQSLQEKFEKGTKKNSTVD